MRTLRSNRLQRLLLLLLPALFRLTAGACAADDRCFRHIGTDDGLSHNSILCFAQDTDGFLWIGTPDGVNRYDNIGCRTFSRIDIDLPCSYITALCRDSAGNMWIGTDCGLTVYEPLYDRFRRIDRFCGHPVRIDNNISHIEQDPDGRMWFSADNQGLFCYDPVSGELKNRYAGDEAQTPPANIGWFSFDADKTLWLSLRFDNLYRFDGRSGSLAPYTLADGSQPFAKDNVTRMVRGPYNTMYVASDMRGVTEIRLAIDRMKAILPQTGKGLIVNDLYLDPAENVLWIATNDGLCGYSLKSGEMRTLHAASDDPYSLSENEITSICTDDAGGLWVGTFNGLNHSNGKYDNFRKYYKAPGLSLAGELVRGFAEDNAGIVWIATKNAGFLRYDPVGDRLEVYRNDRLPKNIYSICYDEGHIWISSHTGVSRLDIATGRLKTYKCDIGPERLSRGRIYRIYRNSLNQIFVCSSQGVLRYDRELDDFLLIDRLREIFVYDMLEDSEGNMWYATYDNGLFRSDIEGGELVNYRNDPDAEGSIPSNKILSVFEDGKGRIWIATHGAGICRFDPAGQRFVTSDFFVREGIGIAYRIIEDNDGDLWITTNKGLVRFRPGDGYYRLYTTDDGLLNNEYDYSSGLKIRNGDIFFGSKDGFVRFNPRYFTVGQTSPKVIVTDFYVNGRLMKPRCEGSPLRIGISRTREIELPPSGKNIAFRVSVLNLQSAADNKLCYRLLGLTDQWQTASWGQLIAFDNLPAGKYVFELEAVSGEGVRSEHPPVGIVVRPQFYRSTGAIILYVAAVLSLLVLIVCYLRKRMAEKHERMQLAFEKSREIEAYNEKIEFFSNIAHEIKTPLTLISTPLNNIVNMETFSPETRDDLNLIKHNTESLSQLIGELLDFSKVEKRGFHLTFTEVDAIERINFLLFGFTGTARSKNLELTFTHDADHIYLRADEHGFSKIVSNLLLNALKYAETYVRIHAAISDDRLVLSVCNDGPIVPPQKRNEIFKPFVQHKDSERIYTQGFGIGLTLARKLAEQHAGSLTIDDDLSCNNFILSLPNATLSSRSTTEEAGPQEEEDEIRGPVRPAILLVEDNREMLRYVERKLKSQYDVLTALNGCEGLETVAKTHIDLIVSDISMPEMNGFDMCRKLKLNFATSHIPIIILSALSSQQIKVQSMDCGADIYIEKPFSLEYLVSCIESLLQKSRQPTDSADSRLRQMPRSTNLSKLDEEFLSKMEQEVVANLSDPDYGIEELADNLCLSRSTLNRKIKGILHTTPNEYIKNMRLIVAAEMIGKGANRINEICYTVGFSSPSYFIKCFKNYFGQLPTEYMENCRNQRTG